MSRGPSLRALPDGVRLDRIETSLLLLAGGVLLILSNGRWATPAAAWLAPVALLRFARRGRARRRLVLLGLLFAVASRVMLDGIIPGSLGLLTWLLTLFWALLWFAPYLVDRLLAPRLPGLAATLPFPLAVVAIEYLVVPVAGTWGALAYTQAGNLPLLQVMAITGMWGVSFLVAWPGPLVNWAWERGFDWSRVGRGVLLAVGVTAGVHLAGGARLALAPPSAPTVRVGGFTASAAIERFREAVRRRGGGSFGALLAADRASARRLSRDLAGELLERSRGLAGAGARVVIWPESTLPVPGEDEDDLLERARRLAGEERIYLLVAYFRWPEGSPKEPGLNKSVLLGPGSEVLWDYRKAHPVPGAREVPGDGRVPVVETPFGRIAGVICYDADFPSLVGQAGRAGAGLLLVPAWDWRAIDPLHARMAAFRAIENGFSMVRQTGEGLSLAVDPQGRVLAEVDHFRSAEPLLLAEVPIRPLPTLYPHVGDLFAWLCLAALAAAALRAWRGG